MKDKQTATMLSINSLSDDALALLEFCGIDEEAARERVINRWSEAIGRYMTSPVGLEMARTSDDTAHTKDAPVLE